MPSLGSIFLVVLGICLAAAPCGGAEIRVFRFIVDGALPYYASCGECAPPYVGARADIAGTFTVSLNPTAGSGALLALDDELVNWFDELYGAGGATLVPRSEEVDSGIIPSYTTSYQPPLDGLLTFDGSKLVLSSDGHWLSPDGLYYSLVTSYTIAIDGRRAVFNMTVPIIDYWITVANATAIEIIPEPSTLSLAMLAVPISLAWHRPRHNNSLRYVIEMQPAASHSSRATSG